MNIMEMAEFYLICFVKVGKRNNEIN